ncbi:D-serine ammonia-lyase ['Osedax' symbiont bacterium Rs2_46_30_T18]|nr:D-serine ammonia-lyase ['Osedax' symbiont bacterium Rs2_46_30_T18]
MSETTFAGKALQDWLLSHPLLAPIGNKQALFWCNPKLQKTAELSLALGIQDIIKASDRLQRFAPYMAKVFPQTQVNQGIIESPLISIERFQKTLNGPASDCGRLLLKCDNQLPISGSVKARGGIYEVIKHAETIAIEAGLLSVEDDYAVLDGDDFKTLFSSHSIVVGSTGNLGLSIGIMSAQLGFKVTVHMSADAKDWKKQLLRDKGVTVIEYAEDYSKAVEQGRVQAQQTARCHFVDDENSQDLFLGYAVAALRLQAQLQQQQIVVDAQHPLFVYLPCGVGGAPGGIAFGLKQIFGDQVHCFFAEPTAAPCMLLGMYTELHDQVSVQDLGLDGVTCADGLAVGRPSAFVGKFMQGLLSGIYTLSDDELYQLLARLTDTEKVALEPSALAGVTGMQQLFNSAEHYIAQQQLQHVMHNATHIAWATGGEMVPVEERLKYYQQGVKLLALESEPA